MTGGPQHGTSSTHLDERLAAALTYLLGLVSGIVFLIIERRSEYVRFHARQSTAFFSVAAVVHFALSGLPGGRVWTTVFLVAVIAAWMWLMFKAVSGDRYRLPGIGAWLDRR